MVWAPDPCLSRMLSLERDWDFSSFDPVADLTSSFPKWRVIISCPLFPLSLTALSLTEAAELLFWSLLRIVKDLCHYADPFCSVFCLFGWWRSTLLRKMVLVCFVNCAWYMKQWCQFLPSQLYLKILGSLEKQLLGINNINQLKTSKDFFKKTIRKLNITFLATMMVLWLC